MRRNNADIPDIYFTSLDAAGIPPTLVLNQTVKTKDIGSWVNFKIWTSEAAKIIHAGSADYGSVRNLVKTSNRPVSKVRHFLNSLTSYTNLTLATREIKKTKAFDRFRNDMWCMDIAYVDELAKDINGLGYPPVPQDLFDRTIDPKGTKT